MKWLGWGATVCVAIAALVGCSPPAEDGAAKQVAKGVEVFEKNCASCHAVNGKGGTSGPDLSKVGAKHDAGWIMARIDNPKSHNPSSRMPGFGEKLGDGAMQNIVAYVASLK